MLVTLISAKAIAWTALKNKSAPTFARDKALSLKLLNYGAPAVLRRFKLRKVESQRAVAVSAATGSTRCPKFERVDGSAPHLPCAPSRVKAVLTMLCASTFQSVHSAPSCAALSMDQDTFDQQYIPMLLAAHSHPSVQHVKPCCPRGLPNLGKNPTEVAGGPVAVRGFRVAAQLGTGRI